MKEPLPPAFAFECSLEQKAILKKLNEVSRFEWVGADSDTYGLYLWADPFELNWPVTYRLFGEVPMNYILDIEYHIDEIFQDSDTGQAMAYVTDVLFPSIEATDISIVEGYR